LILYIIKIMTQTHTSLPTY